MSLDALERRALRELRLGLLSDKTAAPDIRAEARRRLRRPEKLDVAHMSRADVDALEVLLAMALHQPSLVAAGEYPGRQSSSAHVLERCTRCSAYTDLDLADLAAVIAEGNDGAEQA